MPLLLVLLLQADAPVVRVGSKAFTESVILGELLRQLGRDAGVQVRHEKRLGDTSKAWNGLLIGELDAYVEYTGTLTKELFAASGLDANGLPDELAKHGVRMSRSLGFNNPYALGMKEEKAAELGITRISDLRSHPTLKVGASPAFLKREDGWHGVKRRYGLPFATPRGLEHALAYVGLENGSLDVIDLYATDADIKRVGVRVLEDDLGFFTSYEAVLLYRDDLRQRSPEALKAFLRLEGAIDTETMRSMNARVGIDKKQEATAAAEFLAEKLGVAATEAEETPAGRILRMTWAHLLLVLGSLVPAILVAVPLGVVAARRPIIGQLIITGVGIVQTFPALALLTLLIVVTGRIGTVPALIALFVYSLLPIVRNTVTGMQDIPLTVRESAEALGLSSWDKLVLVELPMASRSILAGIKTAAVINVGFATLGGLIAAGGYGEAIMAGLNNNSWPLLLEGAIPAVVMALLVQGAFDAAGWVLVPKGLRLKPAE